ncbi:uncharacterized protein LOC129752276 [Uranotaenia lowii]|uniref:uncharacterized protein LOC129752276 n=1 Tax=Uranotaenia lowii TaxID=190385 RepID=UPI00247AE790|nr:uncharacterized protein LOC129752276 [Uranotaenia lowii]
MNGRANSSSSNSNLTAEGSGNGPNRIAGGNFSMLMVERLRGRENYSSWKERGKLLVQRARTAREAWNKQAAFQDDRMFRRIGLLRNLTGIRLEDCGSVKEHSSNENQWIFDSGATAHMRLDRAILEDAMKVEQRINVANNGVALVKASGSVRLQAMVEGDKCELMMANVLNVPDLALNWISVSKICSNGYIVSFSGKKCDVRTWSAELVAVGRESDGLYKLCQAGQQTTCAPELLIYLCGID